MFKTKFTSSNLSHIEDLKEKEERKFKTLTSTMALQNSILEEVIKNLKGLDNMDNKINYSIATADGVYKDKMPGVSSKYSSYEETPPSSNPTLDELISQLKLQSTLLGELIQLLNRLAHDKENNRDRS